MRSDCARGRSVRHGTSRPSTDSSNRPRQLSRTCGPAVTRGVPVSDGLERRRSGGDDLRRRAQTPRTGAANWLARSSARSNHDAAACVTPGQTTGPQGQRQQARPPRVALTVALVDEIAGGAEPPYGLIGPCRRIRQRQRRLQPARHARQPRQPFQIGGQHDLLQLARRRLRGSVDIGQQSRQPYREQFPRRRVGLGPRLPQLQHGAVTITGQHQTDASRQPGRRATRILHTARQLAQLTGQPETPTLRSDLVHVRRRRCRQPLCRRSALEGASSTEVQIVEQGRGHSEAVDRRIDPSGAQHPPGVGHDQTGVVVSQPGNTTYPVGLVGGWCRRGLLQKAGDGAPVLGTGMGPERRAGESGPLQELSAPGVQLSSLGRPPLVDQQHLEVSLQDLVVAVGGAVVAGAGEKLLLLEFGQHRRAAGGAEQLVAHRGAEDAQGAGLQEEGPSCLVQPVQHVAGEVGADEPRATTQLVDGAFSLQPRQSGGGQVEELQSRRPASGAPGEGRRGLR